MGQGQGHFYYFKDNSYVGLYGPLSGDLVSSVHNQEFINLMV